MFFKKNFIRKYKEKISRLKNRYDKKLKDEKNKFLCVLNHDIKTPLLAQIQTLELLLNNNFGEISDLQRKIIEEILNSNSFLLDVVSNMIFLAKYETQKPQLKLEKVNIIEQIQNCCSLFENLAKDKEQNIVIKTNKKDDIEFSADRKLIQKIIMNLLASSLSFGFEKSDIEIFVKEDKKSISFCAKNKSIYMTKEKIKSLFEDKKSLCDFNQLGMNLNLNIAKKLINAHNWQVIANSNKDNSSVFGFLIKK